MPASNNYLTPLEKAVGFLQGILCEARKLTHVAYLRRDLLMPELLGVRRLPSQSTLSRFFMPSVEWPPTRHVFAFYGIGR